MGKEKITLREIIREAERTEEEVQNGEILPPHISFNNIILHLEQLEERIEGIPQKVRETYLHEVSSFYSTVGWVCKDILGKK